jgi:Spy/CpxP family protein refolding chaperone
MKWLLSVLILGVLIVGNASSTICQDSRSANPGGAPQDKGAPAIKDLRSLIREMFAPVTDKLNLTQEQQFQIIAIILDVQISANPLLQSLDALEQQLSDFMFSEILDENRLQEICDHEAAIMSELLKMKVQAKAQIYRLLTIEQRAIVDQQFHMKAQLEGYLRSISSD